MGSVDGSPRAPAQAYFEMVNIMGEQYFSTFPPHTGMVVVVGGKEDGVLTTWYMSGHQYEIARPKIDQCPAISLVSAKKYKS